MKRSHAEPAFPADAPATRYRSFAEVLARVGNVVPGRIIPYPAPGTARPADAVDQAVVGYRNVELVGGILVEKAIGFLDDIIGSRLVGFLGAHLHDNNAGIVVGARSGYLFAPDLVRIPSGSVVLWDSLDDPDVIDDPTVTFLETRPDLAIEVLSEGNTPDEVVIKLGEYAKAGVRLVWCVDPRRKAVDVYPRGRVKAMVTIDNGGTLDGGRVLPGFKVSLEALFSWGPPGGWEAWRKNRKASAEKETNRG